MLKTVVSLHGIWTRGVWQKDLAPLLARSGFVPYALDYGNFTPWKLLIPFCHGAKLDWLHSEYLRVCKEARCKRPSIIAHSFGGLLVARLLEKFPHVQFDKVILCGSIAPANYAWKDRFASGQVNGLRNEYGTLDIWPRIARKLVRGAGDAGASGFNPTPHTRFQQERFAKYGHSDYFSSGHFEKHWLPHLSELHLADDGQQQVREIMQLMIATVAQHLGMDRSRLRANFFRPTHEGKLAIPPGLHENLDVREQQVILESGTGCTGKAYEMLRQVVAVREGADWGEHEVPTATAQALHPDLRWIASTPVRDPDTHGGILGILNLDGLDKLSDPRDNLKRVLGDLKTFADKLGTLLKAIA